jgi:hypothetical protein
MGTVRQELVPLDDRAAWEEELAAVPHAFAHTWGSCHAMQLTTGWPTHLYVWQDGGARAVCAIAERGDPGTVDVVTPYGFGGFTGVDVGPQLLTDWERFARERGYVCGYLGLNPELAPEALRRSTDHVEYNDVYVLELDRGLDALSRSLDRNRRKQLRAFGAGGERLVHDQERLARYFARDVDAFLRSNGASATYAFTPATWASLLDLEDTFLVGVEEDGGALAAAYLFASTADCGDALFAVSTPSGRRYAAALTWAGAVALTERGVPRLNLGGGVRRGDGIAGFKERFGAARRPLGALQQVYRPTVYEQLCRDVGADPDDRTGYFPAYRRPGARTTSGSSRP